MQRMATAFGTVGMVVLASAAVAAPFQSHTPQVLGGTLIDFEGLADGTLIDSQFPGVTFSQAPFAGRPQIDVHPMRFGYGALSGRAVLTGSTEGGYFASTIAGIVATFASPVTQVQVFLTDTSPLGNYEIKILGPGAVVLETITVLAGSLLPPGYAGGSFPPPGTNPPPGIFLGSIRPTADILGIQIGPSTTRGDSFAIDDLRFVSGPAAVPEPASLALLGSALLGLALLGRRPAS